MSKNLSQSRIDRQNILNNNEALPAIRQHIGLQGMAFEDDYWFTVAQTADFFEVDKRTIQRYLVSFEEELTHNGYTVLKGEKLRQFKQMFGDMIYADLDSDDSQSDIDVTLSEKNR